MDAPTRFDARSTAPLRIVGRSSSHFTRIVRAIAFECDVPVELTIVPNLLEERSDVYGGNPGLRIPTLVTPEGPCFGALNACRYLVRAASTPRDVLWPEALPTLLTSNVQEIVLQGMASEVTWVLVRSAGTSDSPYTVKLRRALETMLLWLEENGTRAIAQLPARHLSYLEVSLFCFLEHLEFREVMTLDGCPRLQAFRAEWAERPSSKATVFRYDT